MVDGGQFPVPPPIDLPAMVGSPAAEPSRRFDIPPAVTPARSCAAQAAAGEIVVCAQDPERFRLRPLPDTYRQEREPGGLETTIGGVTLRQDVEQVNLGGTPSKRVMVRAKIKF